ncbi:hypothetical protein GJR96_13590 [Haloferax sp. MBLA0076]|uniref:Metal-binding protein n=1 Tax=Haloferax litoreum TaxID=2666140 RepID=A0A6A8GKK1_9EURY|nr:MULTISPECIES: UPF0058 family protein [Haloferax]KAB1194416.1 hypothetical protein Hfx1148_13525 [Haloferax sp. CBA1148]MRX22982.1 hypothetical protein [Haloferax litoreum]
MRKNELIHLHTLLVEIAGDFLERGVTTPDDLEPYHRLEIGPMALRSCRDDHETAVRTLSTTLAVCAARDLGRDTDVVPGQHLLHPHEGPEQSDTDQRVRSH